MKRSKKPLPEIEIISFGKYTPWDRDSKSLPELIEMSEKVKAEIGVEFGMLVEIFKGKGRYLDYIINHPPFKNEFGEIVVPFEGQYQIRSNPHTFFLGDTILEPIEDKIGEWTIWIYCEGILLVSKKISLI